MKFEIPGLEPKAAPVKTTPRKKEFKFDPEADLPDNVNDLDELADKLWEQEDWENYERVASHTNKLVGWDRWSTKSKSVSKPVNRISIGDKSADVVAMWRSGKSVREIHAETGLSGFKIRKYLADAKS